MKNKCLKYIYIMASLLLLSVCIMMSGCDQINDVNGSFEESIFSGRLQAIRDDNETHRYFRFHLRQFDNEIGGIFETFDMSSFALFQQTPLLMDTKSTFYYCGRIDYGYVRGDSVHIFFTDREQRSWLLNLKLGHDKLPGTMYRVKIGGKNAEAGGSTFIDQYITSPEFLMPEDEEYYLLYGSNPNLSQIEFNTVSSNTPSMNCIYYYKSHFINIILPPNFPFDTCTPSQKRCHNYRIGIIGMRPQHKLASASQTIFYEYLSAYMDSCDIQNDYIRTVNLREAPAVNSDDSQDVFIGNVIVYNDLNNNGAWDSSAEPILAASLSKTLLFYKNPHENAIYGNDINGKTMETPVATAAELNAAGWNLFEEIEASTPSNEWRVLKKLKRIPDSAIALTGINLRPDHSADAGCYISPAENQVPCSGVLSVLLQ